MDTIATLASASDTVAKFLRLMNLPDSAYQLVIDDPQLRKQLQEYWLLLAPRNVPPTPRKIEQWLKPLPIEQQIDILAKKFGLSLGYTIEWMEKMFPKLAPPLPGHYWAAYPSPSALMKRAGKHTHAGITRYIIEKLGQKIQLSSLVSVEDRFFKRAERTTYALNIIGVQQLGDVWVLPTQLGWMKVGEPTEYVRRNFRNSEFGLPAWMVSVQLFIHREQASKDTRPHIDCPGDYVIGDDRELSCAPVFFLLASGVELYALSCKRTSASCGSASAYISQSPHVSLNF